MSQRITATTHTLSNILEYKGEKILTYKIEYPQFASTASQKAVQRMNTYYRDKAKSFERYIYKTMYQQAAEQFDYAKENGYPIMVYEAEQVYNISYSSGRLMSLYTDQYTFTGGAHGSTVRTSQTWSLPRGYILPLKALFPPRFNYRAYIINTIIKEIELQNAGGESVYFEDYIENVNRTFNEDSFYLTSKGIIIYFQQYDIAPYSTGIPEFLIPYLKRP